MAYFPMFVDLTEKPCLIAGGGKVAYRKAHTLLDFKAKVSVVAPKICGELISLSEMIDLQVREFARQDCLKKALVIAATDDPQKNHEIADFCKEAGIPVNAVDQKEDCTFIFPSYLKEGDVVAAFSSAGKSPALTQYLKAEEKKILTGEIGKLNECLGEWRQHVQEHFETEQERKLAYQRILALGLLKKEVPGEEEIHNILETVAMEKNDKKNG